MIICGDIEIQKLLNSNNIDVLLTCNFHEDANIRLVFYRHWRNHYHKMGVIVIKNKISHINFEWIRSRYNCEFPNIYRLLIDLFNMIKENK